MQFKFGSKKPDKHEHKFELQTKHVLLHRYESEEGVMRPTITTGKDTIKVWVCRCGVKEAVSLERVKA